MKRMSRLIGTAVIVSGKRAGRVSGILLCDGRQIAGLLSESALGGSRVIPLNDISVMGEVSIQCASKGKRAGKHEPFAPGRALTTGGARLGRISDLLIDEHSGRIEAIEISRGYLDDLITSRLLCTDFSLAPQTGEAVVADAFTAPASAPIAPTRKEDET